MPHTEAIPVEAVKAAAGATVTDDPKAAARKWLSFRHPHWAANIAAWEYIRDHYTGAVVHDLTKTKKYLIMRSQGEVNESFEERAKTADYTNHFGVLVDGLVGMLANVDEDALRQWGRPNDDGGFDGLGAPETDDTEAARLWRNADGQGTSWEAFWQTVGIELSLTSFGWILTDSMLEGDAVLRYIVPEAVVNWFHDPFTGALTSALIEEVADVRTGLQDNTSPETRYLLLTVDGWERYKQGRDGIAMLMQAGSWEVGWTDHNDNQTIPLSLEKMPMRRFVGHNLAKKANAIFNKESERDHLLRTANFPRMVAEATDTEFKAIKRAVEKGERLLQGKISYVAPPTAPATLASDVLQQKIEQFYRSGFREYADSARERTATEVMQDAAPGQYAYLTLLASALDSAETHAMNTLTQSLFAGQADLQFQAKVTRSKDFLPADPDAAVSKLISRVFGVDKTLPVGQTGRIEATKTAAKMMGITVEPDEIAAEVKASGVMRMMEAAVQLPWPAPLKALIVMKLVESNGIIDPEETVKLADDTEVKLLDALKDMVEKLAEGEERRMELQGQPFGGFGGPPPPPPNPVGESAPGGFKADTDEK